MQVVLALTLSALSIVDIMTVLFKEFINFNKENYQKIDRDNLY